MLPQPYPELLLHWKKSTYVFKLTSLKKEAYVSVMNYYSYMPSLTSTEPHVQIPHKFQCHRVFPIT